MDFDGKVRIDTEINTSGVDKGIKEVNSGLNSLKKSVGSVQSALKGSAVIAAEVKVLKELAKGVKETAAAYNTQLRAETLLKASAENNPYLNGESVKSLENYASSLQKISTFGDEQLIPFMAQLANAGRTESEIMDIMKASVDVASTGLVSLDQAVKGLNLSYSGSVGQLGQYVPELKNMTAEELKSGEAVKKVKEQFNGMAEATASATGSYEQMKNAAGDYQEALGKITKPTADLWNNFWRGWYERGTENINKLLENIDISTIGKKMAGMAGNINTNGDSILKQYSQDQLELSLKYLQNKKKRNAEEEQNILLITSEINYRKRLNEWETKEAEKTAALNKAKEEQAEFEKKINDYKSNNQNSLDAQLQKIEEEKNLRQKLGEEIDEEAYHQERLNAMMNSYVDLIANSNGKITENNDLAKTRLKQIQEEAEALEESSDNVDKLKEGAVKLSETFDEIGDSLQELTNSLSSLSDSISENYASEQADELDKLNTKYKEGSMSYEDYIKAQEKLDKEYANKKYKLQIAEWSAQLATATANVAQAITKDLAESGGTLGAIKAITTGLIGAAQIASIMASKPKRGFASGGIVGATSGSDNTYGVVGLRTGEMILNAQQQRELWRIANGSRSNGGAVLNMPINIENNTSARVSATYDENQIRIAINNAVNQGFRSGAYDDSIKIQQANIKGRTIL